MLKNFCARIAVSRRVSGRSGTLSSEKGIVLVLVLVLSAVALVFMTALIYMITVGTKVSGLQKKYKTALDAGEGGGNLIYQLISTRADPTAMATLDSALNNPVSPLDYSPTTPAGCSGTTFDGKIYTGLAAKLRTPSTSWNATCGQSLNIDPAVPTTYDMRIRLGTNANFNVFAKIVATTEGNSGVDLPLRTRGVVNANASGEIEMSPKPFLYAIEVVSENSAKIDERAKLSILYQY